MFLLLIIEGFCTTSGDITSPYMIGSNNKIGLWETGGSSLVMDEAILIIPPIQNRKGCIWTDAEIPQKDVWEISVDFKIDHAEGGSFGVWFVSEYGADGTFCGGPNTFKGAALIGNVVRDRMHGMGVALKFIQSSGREQFNGPIVDQDAYFGITSGEELTLVIRFDHGVFKFFTSASSNYESEGGGFLFESKLEMDIKDNYIGLSAQNEHRVMKFELISIKFDITPESSDKRAKTMTYNAPTSQFSPTTYYRLRNPAFNKTIQEILLQEENNGKITKNGTTENIFDIVDEINRANYDVASFSELNTFIRTNLVNYSQKWQRRTLKLVDRVKNTRNVAGAAMNYTTKMMEGFREEMQVTLSRASENMGDIYTLFDEIGSRGIDENNEMKQMADDVNRKSIIAWLIYTTIAEVAGIAIFFISANTCMKKSIYGRSVY